jgi:hypothetical protein
MLPRAGTAAGQALMQHKDIRREAADHSRARAEPAAGRGT